MSNSILEMRNITKTFPGVKALDDVTLTVERGEIHAICGENGAGKSTVIECSARLLPLEKGSVSHHGALVLDHEGRRNRPVHPFGLTLQSNGLVGDETVENHLMTVCALSQMTADLTPLLESYGLAHRRHDRIGQESHRSRQVRLCLLRGC